ncbi:hypothetical protein B0I73DRAFT_39270 [Yarrowia lipolytica]|nr:hypothetical protein B0I73DRAFT_39270 [Yarrowia lipolytica]RDW49244.1 hypothetical protein B0I74DRAFT_17098 [Yarrowia lipolytica]RDW55831.1 hypothetical protein B0I75DRAFT_23685 [Yarrowia lipolytica]
MIVDICVWLCGIMGLSVAQHAPCQLWRSGRSVTKLPLHTALQLHRTALCSHRHTVCFLPPTSQPQCTQIKIKLRLFLAPGRVTPTTAPLHNTCPVELAAHRVATLVV